AGLSATDLEQPHSVSGQVHLRFNCLLSMSAFSYRYHHEDILTRLMVRRLTPRRGIAGLFVCIQFEHYLAQNSFAMLVSHDGWHFLDTLLLSFMVSNSPRHTD